MIDVNYYQYFVIVSVNLEASLKLLATDTRFAHKHVITSWGRKYLM